jgi:hypothetical protein
VSNSLSQTFDQIWLADFEFRAPPGERPQPLCLVARELHSGQEIRLWEDELRSRTAPPYPVDSASLFVAFFASAELGCHLALGWPMPARVLDLYAEFRCHTAGLVVPHGHGLLGALSWHGLDAMDAADKQAMRDLILRGGPYTSDERRAILEYCGQDVSALSRLLPRMWERIDLPRALLRGRYVAAVARMEAQGVPVDVTTYQQLLDGWGYLRGRLVDVVNADYRLADGRGVFDGHTFKADRWAAWLAAKGIPWPRLPTGNLALDDDTFRQSARAHPAEVGPMRELRHTLGQLRLNDLAVGADGRNRVLLSPFASKTGRNQPSTSKFIFGPSCWLRFLIRPGPGWALAYVDWSGQEYGIAARLSGDAMMLQDYRGGDPYLTFGKRIRFVPADATKHSHAREREMLKTACGLGAMYGAGPDTLANTLGVPRWQAWEWLRQHREIYATYWRWSEAVLNTAMLTGQVHTVFGWTLRAGPDSSPRTFRNFPMQGNGAEMLRLACCLATERGIRVCCPVHDALLIEAPADEIDAAVAATQAAMAEASCVVLDGFALRTDVKKVVCPERYTDKRGARMWETVTRLLAEAPQGRTGAPVGCAPVPLSPRTGAHPSNLISPS